jgi:5-methylcytosine-specific restriction endonuclease McrA
MGIVAILNQVKAGDIVLPAIQRDFVWSTDRIGTLLDSVMRGYPIGIVLLWETYEDIQYRLFETDYQPENRYAYRDNRRRRKLKLVLDGQQRLQALNVALFGSYDGMALYFDTLSGRKSDDFRQLQFQFSFAKEADVAEWNSCTTQMLAKPPEEREADVVPEHWVKVRDLFAMGVKQRQQFRRSLSEKLSLGEDDDLRVETNLARFDEVMTKDDNILATSVVDENLPSDNPERKSESDVLEIFVRINRQGTPLNRSDLIFSMLKLNWRESAEALPEFVDRVNKGNSFELDSDFVIRCLFAVCDLGTRFDLDLLRTRSKVDLMKNRFPGCCDAIASTVDFVQRECWCSSSRVLGGSATLIPLVYYLFRTRRHQVPNSQITNVRKAVYLFGFTMPFSRYADSRLGRFIRDELKPLAPEGDDPFPFPGAVSWVAYWERVQAFGEELIRQNPALALNLVQGHSGSQTHYVGNEPQIDHIFPRSVLRDKGFREDEINHFANFWVLSKGKNQNKSNRHPAKYFEDVPDAEVKRALMRRDLLDYRRYRTFLQERSVAILECVRKRLDFTDKDFVIHSESE